MRNNAAELRSEKRKYLPATALIVLVLVFRATTVASVANAQSVATQASAGHTATPQWQIDAGGKLEFDVASIKQDTAPMSPQTVSSNFPLGPGNMYTPNGGLSRATNFPLVSYIGFAYKLGTYQLTTLTSQLPKWVTSDRYDIEARANNNSTKDQMRLMMQALLADRFKLSVHAETRQLPIFALVLVTPGKLGPQLQPYPDGSPCDSSTPTGTSTVLQSSPATVAGGFPAICGGYAGMEPSVPGRLRTGARNVTIQIIADQIPALGSGVDRPVLDKTGLTGMFDFVMEFTPQINGPLPPGANFQPDESGPTFLEALKEQLGLKLDKQTGPVDVFVADHIEQLSEN
jgi:uncharacterized protein (TIGR03435 family)